MTVTAGDFGRQRDRYAQLRARSSGFVLVSSVAIAQRPGDFGDLASRERRKSRYCHG
jgi:hypothetical protein